jgi:hypothetical protein
MGGSRPPERQPVAIDAYGEVVVTGPTGVLIRWVLPCGRRKRGNGRPTATPSPRLAFPCPA